MACRQAAPLVQIGAPVGPCQLRLDGHVGDAEPIGQHRIQGSHALDFAASPLLSSLRRFRYHTPFLCDLLKVTTPLSGIVIL